MRGEILLTGREMGRLDAWAIEKLGIPGVVLMENAGVAASRQLTHLISEAGESSRVVILCGVGNNAGDGYVIGRHLHLLHPGRITVVQCGDPEALGGDAKLNYKLLKKYKVPVLQAHKGVKGAGNIIKNTLSESEIIVDAIFGTGLCRDVKGHFASVIRAINSSKAKVVAIDIPSGVGADDGAIFAIAVKADATITFGYPKVGLLAGEGAICAGQLYLEKISLPEPERAGITPSHFIVQGRDVAAILPKRARDDHKGRKGHVVIVGGGAGKVGAAMLAAYAALRTGAGLVTVLGSPEASKVITRKHPEIMVESWEQGEKELIGILEKADCIAVGPGLGTGSKELKLLAFILKKMGSKTPLVLDADALNLVSRDKKTRKLLPKGAILTPHPGEMARLRGLSSSEVQEQRVDSAKSLSSELGVVTLLKGFRSIISDPEGNILVNTTGNPGLAKGGSGDTLTGIVAALAAAGVSSQDAAGAGAFIHGYAADRAAEEVGEDSLTAEDVTAKIAEAIKETRKLGKTAISKSEPESFSRLVV